MTQGSCECPPGYACGEEGLCHQLCNLASECGPCEICSSGMCIQEDPNCDGGEQECSIDKDCDESRNQICVVLENDANVCQPRGELRVKSSGFGSEKPDWVTKEFSIRGGIAPVVGTSRSDQYIVHPNNQ